MKKPERPHRVERFLRSMAAIKKVDRASREADTLADTLNENLLAISLLRASQRNEGPE